MKENNEARGFSRFLANIRALFSKKNKKQSNSAVGKENATSEIKVNEETNLQTTAIANEEVVSCEPSEGESIEAIEEPSTIIADENSQNEIVEATPSEIEETNSAVVLEQIDVENKDAVAETQSEVTTPSTVATENIELTPQQEYVQSRNMNVTVPETTIRSFLAKLLQVNEETQQYYSELKNYVLSFVGTRCRTSWQYDSIYKTRILLARFVIRGKSLWQYVALTPDEVPEGTNCQVTDDKKYEGIEVGLKIQGQRTFKQARNLLKLACEKIGLAYEEREKENYIPDFMSEEEMLEKGYIKKVLTSTNPRE